MQFNTKEKEIWFYCQLRMVSKKKLKTNKQEANKIYYISSLIIIWRISWYQKIQKDSIECVESLIFYLHFSQSCVHFITRAMVRGFKSLIYCSMELTQKMKISSILKDHQGKFYRTGKPLVNIKEILIFNSPHLLLPTLPFFHWMTGKGKNTLQLFFTNAHFYFCVLGNFLCVPTYLAHMSPSLKSLLLLP